MRFVRSSTTTSRLGPKMLSNSKIRKLLAITLVIGNLSVLMVTAIIFVSVKEWLPTATHIEGAGLPFAYAALVCGLASACAVFYSAYMLFSKWDSTKFVSLVQILLGLYSASVVVSCVLFIIKTNLFGLPGAVGVVMAFFISLPLIFVLQLVKNDRRLSPLQG